MIKKFEDEEESETQYVRAVRGGQSRMAGHIFIFSPVQASFLEIDSKATIQWETQQIGGNVSISLTRDGGKTYETIASSTPNDGHHYWTVTGPPSVNCMIKIVPESDPSKGSEQGFFTILKPMWTSPIPDTGQTGCCDIDGPMEVPTCPAQGQPFYGQDGYYTINGRSFTKLGADGQELPDDVTEWIMVRDNVTGLIWEVKTSDGTVHDATNTYSWYDPNAAVSGSFWNTNTKEFIDELNSEGFGGFSGWRLPTIQELGHIVNYDILDMGIYANYFSMGEPEDTVYWSSTSDANDETCAWYNSFGSGYGIQYVDKENNSLHAIAVRGDSSELQGATPISPNLKQYQNNQDGTVTDVLTGLMWRQEDSGQLMNWENALAYCEEPNGNYDDWRLPSINELYSLIDFGRYAPSRDPNYFPATDIELTTTLNHRWYYWSSTSGIGACNEAYNPEFVNGTIDSLFQKDDAWSMVNVRAARGGQNRFPDNLFILVPVQASILKIGAQVSIQWETRGIASDVAITLSRNGGKIYDEIIADETANDGQYSWTVTGPVSVNCMLKIEPVDLDYSSKGTVQGLFTIYADPPDPPTIGVATVGIGKATVAFTPPAVSEYCPISFYTVTSNPDGKTATGLSSPITVSNLTVGTDYTFTVTATNAFGVSQPSEPSNNFKPLGTYPGAPTNVTAIAGNTQATVSFTPPESDGGSAITCYTVTSSPEGRTATGSTSPITVTGLSNGTVYTFTVRATNSFGQGVASLESNFVMPENDDELLPALSVSPSTHTVESDYGSTIFNVANTGAGTMDWSASVISDGDWLQIESGSGTDDGDITLNFDENDGKSRTGTIRITANGASNSPTDVTVIQAGTTPILSVTPVLYEVAAPGGTTTFEVSNVGGGTMGWSASVTSGGSWLRVKTGLSGINSGSIASEFDENIGSTPRTGTIRITATGASGSPMYVNIIQSGLSLTQPVLSVTPVMHAVAKESGTTAFNVSNPGTGTMAWNATVISGEDWLRITSGAAGTNTGIISCAFDENTVTELRTAVIRITSAEAAGSPMDVTVTQDRPGPKLSVNPSVQIVGVDQGITTFEVSNTGQGSLSWSARIAKGADWISLISASSGTDLGTITCEYSFNPDVKERYANIVVTSGYDNSSQTVMIYQKGNKEQISVQPYAQEVPKKAGITAIAVSNIGGGVIVWTARIVTDGSFQGTLSSDEISDTGWISIVGDETGINDGHIILSLTANNTGVQRTALIEVSALDQETQYVTITQSADCGGGGCDDDDNGGEEGIPVAILDVNPPTAAVSSEAGKMPVTISNTGNADTMNWGAKATSDGSWLSIPSEYASGMNDSVIDCKYAANTKASDRYGTVGVTATYDNADASGSPSFVTITQDKLVESTAPALKVEPLQQEGGQEGGTVSFTVLNLGAGTMYVTANVISGGDWLKIQPGVMGADTDSTIVVGEFGLNDSENSRIGVIRIEASGAIDSPTDVILIQAGLSDGNDEENEGDNDNNSNDNTDNTDNNPGTPIPPESNTLSIGDMPGLIKVTVTPDQLVTLMVNTTNTREEIPVYEWFVFTAIIDDLSFPIYVLSDIANIVMLDDIITELAKYTFSFSSGGVTTIVTLKMSDLGLKSGDSFLDGYAYQNDYGVIYLDNILWITIE